MSRLLDDVVRELSRLPGIGRRTALRLAMHILRSREDDVAQMIRAIGEFRTGIRYCARCNNLSDNEFCEICSDPTRDRSQICVVEQVGDVMSIEKTGQFRGLYHVLGGVISPMAGIAPSDLKIDLLVDNIAASSTSSGINSIPNAQNRGTTSGVKEVILAISTTVEGETTLFYIMNRLRAWPELKITTIARGIGFGDEIEYADELTISHAIANRREIPKE
ncbi:MAG: recombination mediator RecR [Alistipes sp.]|jgi:recombination protein RecR|nr:recombination mediator RecR [Alistipes sp.]